MRNTRPSLLAFFAHPDDEAFSCGGTLAAAASRGIDVTVIADGAVAHLVSSGLIDCAVTGADRIARNGDAANKIGTQGVACILRTYDKPFYVAAPLSTIDRATPSGSEIPIEIRADEEVTAFHGVDVSPDGALAQNFAFDVTPYELVAGIITEMGVLESPFEESIRDAFERAGES